MCQKTYYNQLMEQWFLLNEPNLAMSSSVKYHQLFYKYIRPFFRNIPVSQISEELLESYKRFLVSKCNGEGSHNLSSETVRCISMLVNQCLVLAQKEHMLSHNLRLNIRLKKSRNNVQVFSSSEQEKLEDYLRTHPNISTVCVLLCLYTGLRIGELCSLKWSDIDLEEDVLYVNRTVQRLKDQNQSESTALFITPPKTDCSLRAIPIPDFIKEVLYPYVPKRGEGGYILSDIPQTPMDPRTMQYRYKKYLREAGVPYRKFHTLRHTFATRCLMSGMDAKTLSELLGHADVKTTLNYYCHTTLEYKREQLNLLSPFFVQPKER